MKLEKAKLSQEKSQKLSRGEFKKLCGQIRRSDKYQIWKSKVLKRDKLEIKFPNVHHKKSFTQILINNEVQSLDDAIKCKELWELDNGITISRGEHRIITLLERIKYPSQGFLEILREYIGRRK